MNPKNVNLLFRIGTAAVAIPLLIVLLVRGGWWTTGLIALAAAACAGEYYAMTLKGLPLIAWLGMGAAATFPLAVQLQPARPELLMFGTLGAFFIVAWTHQLLRGPLADSPGRVAHLLTGVVYAGMGLAALAALRASPAGLMWIIAVLTATWANDTGAYFAGRFLGRHPLYREVSPNKTWEGFFGGFLGSIGALFLARALFFADLTPLDCVACGVLAGIFGPIGDLCESMLKRACQVKDSGRIIPGHGGLLDRVDALLFNAPVLYLYVAFLRGVP